MDASGCTDLFGSGGRGHRLEDVDWQGIKELVGNDEGRLVGFWGELEDGKGNGIEKDGPFGTKRTSSHQMIFKSFVYLLVL